MLIRIRIERAQPLAGIAAAGEGEPIRFEGWLELLGVLSELVAGEQRCTPAERLGHDRTTGEGRRDADSADRDVSG
jgi:hypothetical protein